MSTALCAWVTRPADEARSLAGALRRRDPEVLEGLVELYGNRLLRYLVHLTGERALAEDLFQETWLRVLERGRQYDPSRPFVAWLLAVARNLTVDLLRKKRPLSLEALQERDEGSPLDLARDTGPSPLEAAAAHEARDRVAAVLAGLPAVYREVLFLRFTEELSLEDIARVTGLGVPTVKSRLYRGLDHLASRMGARA
jgi:RNA polymerase sigma-70 factor, ECF subfamily